MTKQCCVCGKTFDTNRKSQITCGDEACKKEQHREYLRGYMMQYRMNNRNIINQKNKEYMRKVRSETTKKNDSIIGLGYAERQKAKTLAMVGGVRTEL